MQILEQLVPLFSSRAAISSAENFEKKEQSMQNVLCQYLMSLLVFYCNMMKLIRMNKESTQNVLCQCLLSLLVVCKYLMSLLVPYCNIKKLIRKNKESTQAGCTVQVMVPYCNMMIWWCAGLCLPVTRF